MKVLVTGASGFVGAALCAALRRQGHAVVGLGRRAQPEPWYQRCDLTQGMPDIAFMPDVVVHCAARSAPWGSQREFERQNVAATRYVVDYCESHGRPFLVHISTSAVMYTQSHQLGLTENTPLPPVPINRYAATKREAETVVSGYAGRHCIVRPRAVFGPGDTVVFPRILRAARAGRLPWIESEQEVVGDLIYIDTLVDYLLRIVERQPTGLYLLTNNAPVPILAFLADVFTRLQLPQPQRRIPVRRALRIAGVIETVYRLLPFLGEPPLTRFGVSVFAYSKTFDVTKALRDLGPPSVPLTVGVERFIAWQARQPT
jgi:nucleoside-diphosphate-sugar epimerase